MKIAVEGCCHGELDKIYETLAYLEKCNGIKVDLLLICGDFQSVRNRSDLQSMAVPPKYQKMNTFWKYFSGEKKAPVLTVFIGGNHEASNYLQELPYGGWVAPNIYYLGYAGVVQFGGVRIAGLSGIYKARDLNKGHFEHPPYSEDTKRSCYHVRNLEVFRLKQLQKPIDILLSHDWPRGIYNYGDVDDLLRKKKFFRDEVNNGTLGSAAAEELLFKLKPDYWFSAHLHVKFAGLVQHKLESGDTKQTKFLALDKCLPKRKFLQVVDIPNESNKPLQLELDPEWLCVLKSTNHLLSLTKGNRYMPGAGCSERWEFTATEEELKSVSDDFGDVFKIPDNFEKTVPDHDPKMSKSAKIPAPQIQINPQTTLMCEMLGLTDPYAVFCGKQQHSNVETANVSSIGNDSAYLDESSVADDSTDFIETTMEMSASLSNTTFEMSGNPDEISLDDLDEDECEEIKCQEGSKFSLPSPVQSLKLGSTSFNNSFPCSNQDEILANSSCFSKKSPNNSVSVLEGQESLNISMDSTSSSTSSKRGIDLDLDTKDVPESDSVIKSKKFKRRNQSLYSTSDDAIAS